jgi:hypothetical protein
VIHDHLIFSRYNGQISNGDLGRQKSKFQLRQRIQANGIKAKRQHKCKNAEEAQVRKKRNGKKEEQFTLIFKREHRHIMPTA